MFQVIQSLSAYPKLVNFGMTILTKLISKQVSVLKNKCTYVCELRKCIIICSTMHIEGVEATNCLAGLCEML